MTATRELKEYQDTPSTQEILAKIPLLKREDIEKKAETFFWKEKKRPASRCCTTTSLPPGSDI